MRYKDFVLENTEKHAVLAFGRLSPPTTGHEVLVNKVKEVAKSTGGSHHVVLSHTQDSSKNPLSSAQKLKHAKRFFPNTNLSVSDKESPTFLQHAAKLHKSGVTHLHMIAGSDRVPEYEKKLAQYNGTHKGALYNFKKITVHSAGERDPDAEGTSGMSASKMRGHAASGKFKEFKKGIPAHVSDDHAKELYNDVRKGMQIKEGILGAMAGGIVGGAVTKSIKGVSVGSKLGSALQNQFSKNKKKSTDINEEFKSLLFEGVHDKSIFKAVFLAGGPGSGKDYVMDNTLKGHGLVEINSDILFEILMKREGLDMTMPDSEKEIRDMLRGKSKTTTDLKQALAISGRNGVIVNGTGDNIEKTRKIKEKLEQIGYDTSMILVNTDDEISKKRNIARGMRGGRTIPENTRKEKWSAVQENRPEYAKLFGDKYVEFDNSVDTKSEDTSPEIRKSKEDELKEIWNSMRKFTSGEPTAESAKMWISMEMDKKDKLPIPKDGVVKVAHPDAGHEEEANKLGLQYYGFGRYGKDGHVTHRSVNGNLVEIPKVIPKSPKIPSQGTSMSKNVNDGGRTEHKIGDETIHVKINKKKIDEGFIFEVVGQGGRDYEGVINDKLKKYGNARPDATTAGSSADAPDATFLHKNKEHHLEIKKDKGAMFGQIELHHNGKSWDISERSKNKYPETHKQIQKSGFLEKLNKQWKKPSGNYEQDLKMGNVYHNHPNADPIKAHYGKDRKTNYIQIGGGHGFYHTGNDVAKLNSPELHGQTQIRARMKPRGYDKTGKRTYGALAVMSLKGDVNKSHHDLDKDPKKINEDFESFLFQSEELLFEEKKTKLLRDVNGKLRIFHIRRSATTTANQIRGNVMVHPKGFVVKLNKENDNARENIEFFQETGTTTGSENRTGTHSYTSRSSESTSESALRKEAGDEQVQQKKLTLQEIRARQKEKFSGDTEQIVELSNEKLAAYKTAASASATAADKAGDFKKGNKRFSGIIRATNKQFKNDAKK